MDTRNLVALIVSVITILWSFFGLELFTRSTKTVDAYSWKQFVVGGPICWMMGFAYHTLTALVAFGGWWQRHTDWLYQWFIGMSPDAPNKRPDPIEVAERLHADSSLDIRNFPCWSSKEMAWRVEIENLDGQLVSWFNFYREETAQAFIDVVQSVEAQLY